ncbi:class I adenylate-forming enzyme family protein [Streptomyces sp. MB09-02B]|uniref:class I adenylate-forming enzyme family protein n=1 Tax=Streptomyces sp. MB09-02B TaxID=3028667 RepID=UPI0029B9F9BB|nr:class I adenylate-forming enzyme family protein [Streptomyces sp. MB09-02B]MDX3639994.1 class I adenylate-forming enzyme family protein [Streptomyces sp. MB09-02B]
MLERSAKDSPGAPALTDGRLGLTYRQLLDCVREVAGALARAVEPGDRIALQIRRSAEYVVLYLAVLELGGVVVPLATDLSEDETARELDDCEPRLLIRDAEGTRARPPGPDARTAVLDIAVRAGVEGHLRRLRPSLGAPVPVPSPPRDPESPAVLLGTSGSSGLPKRVELAHRSVLASARAHRASLGAATGRDTTLVTVPLGFGYCNTVQLVGQLAAGGHIVLLDGDFLPSRFGRLVEQHRVTSTLLVPAMLRLLGLGDWHRACDLSSLRHIVFGGAPTPAEVLAEVTARLPGTELIETYGQTEAGPRITTLRQRDRADRPRSVGRAVPGMQITIRDRAFRSLPTGRAGEIVVRGDGVMTGYHARPEETAEVLRDGWLRTGDLGRLDDDGFLQLCGRLRNIAIVNGINVSLEEVEACLTRHAAVVEAVCDLERDERSGESLTARIRLADGTPVPSDRELLGFCRARLSPHKVPRRIVVVDDFPRTRNGKIARHSRTA